MPSLHGIGSGEPLLGSPGIQDSDQKKKAKKVVKKLGLQRAAQSLMPNVVAEEIYCVPFAAGVLSVPSSVKHFCECGSIMK